MAHFYSLITQIPLDIYIAVLDLICILNIVLISPILFKFWVIPRIENKYKTILKLKAEDYPLVPFANWSMTPLAISFYVFCKYTGYETIGIKNPVDVKTISYKLKKANYDISSASKSEIILSFIMIFSALFFYIGGAYVALH